MCTVVDRAGDDTVWKGAADLIELGGNALRNGSTILADQEHRGAHYHLISVERGRTGP